MKIRAIYCRKDYNAFDEHSDGEFYGIDVEVPDDTSLEFLENEAKKPVAIKNYNSEKGHKFLRLDVL